ncbi:variable surface protein Vir6-like [Plasmodium vivax]|uniref:Variable surface protein Vir6-like n=1 Tax=Plasmodium vivax (strain Salvador I) TaxID=126793 RepID=A5KD22_PLAVS|nr:variable surface protein Vir6-like [Plasmodium vivax]EDL42747.1 variable surface protein Vir6-like [Plasmodium vivax]|eukprot:XP_001612540.1 variable surface protein Vir6-like [Plasmodium vivax Sal-1]
MSYHCYSSDGDYLDFKCYNRYKERFIDRKNRKIHSDCVAPVKAYISELSSDKKKFEKVFEELALYLSDGQVLYNECNIDICCRYMSYLIHEKIRNLNNTNYDENIFKDFQNFAKMVIETIGMNKCKKNFNYLTTNVINKMQILYKLYDYYNEIITLKENDEDYKTKLCNTLSLFVKTFNEINVDLLEDEAFYRKLEELKNFIKPKHAWTTDKTCPSNLNSITLKKKDPPSETVASHQNQAQLALTHSLTSEVVQGQQTYSGSHVAPKSVVQSGLEEPLRSDTGSTSHVESGLRDSLESNGTLSSEEELASSLSKELDNGPKAIEMLNPSYEREPVGTYRYSSFYRHNIADDKHIDTRDEGRLIGNLQTPTDDQGVLYTPVGTFFRGGRGRAHRIPRSFNGQFLGGFQGYEDYDVGHIGYGPMNPLAE